MALLYDGSQFIGVDDDAYGDGTGSTTQPLDAWLQTRIQANIEYLADEPRLLCFSPVISSADDYTTISAIRPYTQMYRGSVWRGLIIGHPNQSGLKLHLAYSSFTVTGNGGQGDISALVRVKVGGQIVGSLKATLPETETAGSPDADPDVGVVELEVEFERTLVQQEDMIVTLSVKTIGDNLFGEATNLGDGLDGIEEYSTGDGYGYANRLGSTAPPTSPGDRFWEDSNTTPHPDHDSLEAMFARLSDSVTTNQTANVDLLMRSDEDNGGTAGGGSYALVYPPLGTNVVPAQAGNLAYQAYLTQSFFLRAMAYEAVFDATSLDVDRQKYESNRVLASAESYSQHSSMRVIHRRPRLIAMGPRGFKDSDVSAYDNLGYALHWPLTFGNETGDNQILVEDSIYLTTNSPDLAVTVSFISVQLQTAFNFSVGAAAKKRANNASSVDKYNESDLVDGDGTGAGEVDWNITVGLDQLDDGSTVADAWAADSTSYASSTKTVRLPLHPASFDSGTTNGQPPVAIALDAQAYANKGSGGRDGNFWYKEGTLYADDLRYVETQQFIVETSSVTQSTNKLPYRLKISAALDSVIDYLRPEGSPTDDVRLTLVSYTVHELPKDPLASATEALSNPLVTAETGALTLGGITGEAP